MEDPVERFLSHYGVRGMKWGVRRRSGGGDSGGSARSHRRRTSEDFKTAKELRKKKHKKLTNEEIKKANERANLESNFVKLNPGKVERGHRKLKVILAVGGTVTSIYALRSTELGKDLVKAIIKEAPKVAP